MSHAVLDEMLTRLAAADGSDLHIKVGSPARIRVNGALGRLEESPAITPELTAEMAGAIMRDDVAEHFEVSNDADFAYAVPALGRFRVNAFRQRGTVGLIFRRVRTSAASFAELGLPDIVRRLSEEHRGLVLVTGPTGSGKTTTLAAMVDYINISRECHIVTIEDPIEVLHRDKMSSINQREVGFDTNSFATAMRAAMRQDPDVIFVGEMRDQETVSAALSADETGHRVLSTLHTIDSTETINRIVDFFPPHQQHQIRVALAGSLKGTICQRLVQTADGEGRIAALEVMVNNGRIQQCIIEPARGGDVHEIIQDGEYYGMQTFDQALVKLYEAGKVDLRGAMTAASNPHDLKVMLQQRGLLASTSRSVVEAVPAGAPQAVA